MIAYHSKTSTTGKLLRTLLAVPRKRTQRRAKVDYFLRWGTSEQFPVRARVELNSIQAVANTTNKLRMLELLADAGLPTPSFTTDSSGLDGIKDATGNYYIRSKLGVVRYSNDFNSGDSYASQPIPNKRREYRVHVFNSKIIAIYEKVPHGKDTEGYTIPALFKSHNCHFRLVNPDISLCDAVGQKIAIDSVNALGLLFGGVDLIRDKDKNFFVCEVNSAPGLNSNNAQRWVTAIKEYINAAGVSNDSF